MLRLTDPDALLSSPLVPDERIVHHLVGVATLDERLSALSQPVATAGLAAADPAERSPARSSPRWAAAGPVVLHGPQPATTRAVAAAACAAVGLTPRLLGAADLAATTDDLVVLLRRLVRETVLARRRLARRPRRPARRPGVGHRARPRADDLRRPARPARLDAAPGAPRSTGSGLPVLEVPRLGVGDRHALARCRARPRGRRRCPPQRGRRRRRAPSTSPSPTSRSSRPRSPRAGACGRPAAAGRAPTSASSPGCASRGPAGTTSCCPSRSSSSCGRSWPRCATARRCSRTGASPPARAAGCGTAALFAGASGTGKTFAAEVIAHELELDLVHVDLSQVVDKYLGETEKRLLAPLRRRRGRRHGAALRRGRRALRQAVRGQGQPRPLRQRRGRLPPAAARVLRAASPS